MISFCTPYTKDRIYQLDMVSPENEALCEEYGCEWIRLFWEDDWEWNMARAWNMAHEKASGDIQVTFGCDCFITRVYVEDLIKQFNENMDILVTASNGGRIAISGENFKKLGGYDETMTGWGCEDLDMTYRARALGLTCKLQVGIDFIPHSDHMRFPDADRKRYQYQNWAIMRSNFDNKIIDWREK